MVWAKRATVQSKVGAAQAPSNGAYMRTQIATMMVKKSWPREASAMVAQAGMMNRTAMPPRAAWARNTATAAQARRAGSEESLPDGRGSDWVPSEPRPLGSDLDRDASELRSDGQAGGLSHWDFCIHNASPTVSRPT